MSTLDSFVGQERRILCVWSFLPREPVSSRPLRVSTSRKKGRLTEQRAPLSPDWKRIVSLKKIRFPLHSASTRLIAPSSRKRPLHSVNCPVFPCLPSPLAILFSFQTCLFPRTIEDRVRLSSFSGISAKYLVIILISFEFIDS